MPTNRNDGVNRAGRYFGEWAGRQIPYVQQRREWETGAREGVVVHKRIEPGRWWGDLTGGTDIIVRTTGIFDTDLAVGTIIQFDANDAGLGADAFTAYPGPWADPRPLGWRIFNDTGPDPAMIVQVTGLNPWGAVQVESFSSAGPGLADTDWKIKHTAGSWSRIDEIIVTQQGGATEASNFMGPSNIRFGLNTIGAASSDTILLVTDGNGGSHKDYPGALVGANNDVYEWDYTNQNGLAAAMPLDIWYLADYPLARS